MPPKTDKKGSVSATGGDGDVENPGHPPRNAADNAMEVDLPDGTAQEKALKDRIVQLEYQLNYIQQEKSNLNKEKLDLQQENNDLQELVDAFQAKENAQAAPTSSGQRLPIDERLRELGFYRNKDGDVQRTAAEAEHRFNAAQPYAYPNSLEIGGTRMDFQIGCDCHKDFKLNTMVASPPASADAWGAATPYDLARGAAVVESTSMTASDKDNFFKRQSNWHVAVAELGMAEPSEEQLVLALTKFTEECPARKAEFTRSGREPLKCSNVVRKEKANLKVRVAERVRATLDGHKNVIIAETIIIGGTNAVRLASNMGQQAVVAESLSDASQMLCNYLVQNHFGSSVKRVLVWPDASSKNFAQTVLAEFMAILKEAVVTAASWKHVVFVVFPMPYTDQEQARYEPFMEQFNSNPPRLPNVLWLSDDVRWNGISITRSLGSHELCVDHTAVYPEGNISKRGAAAATKFLQRLCSWLITDESSEEAGPSTSSTLHGVREGRIQKNPARGAPFRGGGGGRGNSRGRGNQQFGGRRGNHHRR